MFKKIIFLFMLLSSITYSKIIKPEKKEVVVGENHLKLNLELWNAQVDGKIKNPKDTTDIKDDLKFKSKNITAFGTELSTNYVWLPDIKVDYFTLEITQNSNLGNGKTIKNTTFVNDTISNIKYNELNSKVYGYVKNQNFKFDLGINLKKIDYTQYIKDGNNNNITIEGPTSLIVLPYLGVTLDLGPLKFNANSSILAFGDDEAKDYEYSLSLTTFDNVELFGGYRYHELPGCKHEDEVWRFT